jgi:hypothetical protein
MMENRLKQDGIQSWYQLVNQYETESNRQKSLKMSLHQSTIDIIEEDCLNGFKTMKMPSLSLLYLERRYGMMMVARYVRLFRVPKILAW